MEESHYLMWIKRKQILKSHIQEPFGGSNNNNNNSSWEERAFAEDAARILGGCIWPPRSYSCNFCRREFRSAQALGGHMNVHRRDRARLKQSLSSDNEALHHHHKNDCKSSSVRHFSAQNSSKLDCCDLKNPYSNLSATVTTNRISSSRPSTISTQENCCHPIMPSSASINWGQQHTVCPDSEPKGVVVNAKKEEFLKGLGCNNNDCVETSLSVGQSSVFGQKLLPTTTDSCGGGDDGISYKRPKTCSIPSLPVLHKPCSNGRHLTFQSAEYVLGLKPGMEDLDLELRLGKPQKVN
ncbi:hypothetical protein RJT34_19945 [Clitoria ternatea]|uniref:C2H2-type domain-containing protein n=1 Tax=Clitoria ternatea TaxID=43366 RepID=A0AAN9P578_CLITE